MASAKGIQKEEGGWLKRLRVQDGTARQLQGVSVMLPAGSRPILKGHVHVEGSCTITRDNRDFRGRIQNVGFLRDVAWSCARNLINTYKNIDAPKYFETSSTIKLPDNRAQFTHACASASDRLYCLTERRDIYTANLELGTIEGRIPFVGSKYDFDSFKSIVPAAPNSPDWSLLSVIDDRGRIHIIDNRTNGVVRKLNAATQIQAAEFVSEATTGGTIIAGSASGELFKWDLRSEECIMRQKVDGALGILNLHVRSQDNLLFLADSSGLITQHRLNKSKEEDRDFALIKQYPNLAKSADVLVGHKSLPLLVAAHSGSGNCLKMINISDKCIYQNWPGPKFDFGIVTAAAFDERSGMIALGNDRGSVKVWNFDSW